MAYTSDLTGGLTYQASDSIGDANSPADGSGAFDDSSPIWNPTWWFTNSGSNTNQWVSVDFGTPVVINRILVHHGSSGFGGQNAWRHLILQGSSDHSVWTKIPATSWDQNASQYNTDEAECSQVWVVPPFITTSSIVSYDSNTTAYRYYRPLIVTNWGYTAIGTYEIEMFSLYEDGVIPGPPEIFIGNTIVGGLTTN
jgi:hypothetical protein